VQAILHLPAAGLHSRAKMRGSAVEPVMMARRLSTGYVASGLSFHISITPERDCLTPWLSPYLCSNISFTQLPLGF
jgi:hypothetical protein